MDPLIAGLKKGLEKYVELIADGTIVENVKKLYEIIDWLIDVEFYKKWLKLNGEVLEEVEVLREVEEKQREVQRSRREVDEKYREVDEK
jgi:hypothetical protein